MDSNKPIKKMQATGYSGAVVLILLFAARQMGLELTPEVAGAVVLLASWVAGYMKADPLIAEARELLKKKLEHEAREGDGE